MIEPTLHIRRPDPVPTPSSTTKAVLDLKSSKLSPSTSITTIKPSTTCPAKGKPTLMTLPPEIHLLISRNLIYPDALSLKHSSRYFYYTVDTGVRLKVEWLMQRRQLHLDCPNNRKCDLGSDLRFCRGSVRLLMQRRREHMECESRPGLGCLVYGTASCTHRKTLGERWKRWMRRRLTVELWWILLALVPVILAWVWMGGLGVVFRRA